MFIDASAASQKGWRGRDSKTRPEAGSLRLGVFPTIGPYLLPHVVPTIRARFPRLELLLVEEKTEVLLAMLRDGRLDAAVLALPLHEDWLECEFLFEEPFVLAVPEGHALATAGELTLSRLSNEHLLLLEDGHCLRDQALEVCALAMPVSPWKNQLRAVSCCAFRTMSAEAMASRINDDSALTSTRATAATRGMAAWSISARDSHPHGVPSTATLRRPC